MPQLHRDPTAPLIARAALAWVCRGMCCWACIATGCAPRTRPAPVMAARPAPAPRRMPGTLPAVVIDQPAAGTLVRDTEVTVSGRVWTDDGRAWVYVDSTVARVKDGHFIAERVPVREGRIEVQVHVADGRWQHAVTSVALVVESPDRPRSADVCTGHRCLRYEVRGRPVRDAAGRVANAVLVLPAFGLDERLDEMWPDLVGPGRALDPREQLVIGVGEVTEQGTPVDDPQALWPLLAALDDKLGLAERTPVVGVAYGGELALRGMANGALRGAVLVCGAHDRPFDEPAMRALRAALRDPAVSWETIARLVVPATYGARYLADASHAVAQGLVDEASRGGLAAALEHELAAHFQGRLAPARLAARVEQAFSLEARPLAYPSLDGRRVILVDDLRDGLAAASRVHALALRLHAAGARVTTVDLDDPAGHAAFFLGAPLRLEAALRALVEGPR